jgi:spermidine/putrescine transport system permease protein
MQPAGRQNNSILAFLLSPTILWLVLFFVAPLLVVLAVSFSKRSLLGVVEYDFNLDNYRRVFSNVIYLRILWRSTWLALVTTTLCLLVGYPFAFFIARQTPARQRLLIFLVMVPFWTNFLVRTYALIFVVRDTGFINNILLSLGIIDQPLRIMFTQGGVLLGMLYGYLPFAVLPLYASIEQLDFNYVQAAQDLGANSVKVFWRIVLPLTMPGVVAASIITFIPTLGAYVTPDLMGGGSTFLVGNLLQQQFMTVRDWPFGSALGFIMMLMVLASTLFYFRVGGNRTV